jgi:hypothetical protein
MSQNSSRETRAKKVSFSMGSISAHAEPNMKISRVATLHSLLEIVQYFQATDFVNLLAEDESWFFEHKHHAMMSGLHPEMAYRKHP